MARRRRSKKSRHKQSLVGMRIFYLVILLAIVAVQQGWIAIPTATTPPPVVAEAGDKPAKPSTKPTDKPAASTDKPATKPELDWDHIAALPWPKDGQFTYKSYDEAKRVYWRKLYPTGGIDLYCAAKFDASRNVGATEKMSIEHAFPADSIAEAHNGCTNRDCSATEVQRAEGDMNNLWPAIQRVNSSRGKLRYGEISGEASRRFTNVCPDFERTSGSMGLVEPRDEVKGDVARSIVYMHFTYGLPFEPVVADKDVLLRWMSQDPPDAEERRRNTVITSLQGAGNPLITVPGS